ncbi:small conductance mechanosensitive channel [Haloactinospora alba]|uniref:Small conductance mechanosensitive channel n=1 Tax=Haloactinospora alba TaxID=405555 RepID=A0A543NNP6_9ACTN|nr:mechanosensitive ion channel family protein [Haloactinospora alba]TQN33442.1 small conductance mechanosensitive channel [Haloactinospora alba]
MPTVSIPLPLVLEKAAAVEQAGPVVDWITDNSGAMLGGATSIIVIVILAVVARAVAGRLITQLVRRMVSSRQRLSNTKAARNVISHPEKAADPRQEARAETLSSVLRSLASFVIYGIAFVMVLGEVGINLGPILASAGVLGLAVGFGAQGLVQDFLSGMFMMVEDQYGVGDVIDVGDAVGTVEEVGMRITKIRDLDGGLWHIRNGQIMRVCNMNQDWANAVVELPLAYSVDLSRAREVIEESIADFSQTPEFESQLLDRPEVSGVVGIANGAMTVRIIARTRPGEQWALGRSLREHLKRSLDRNDIEVAFPMPSFSPS